MNILVVSTMFPPIQTGTSIYTKNIAKTLDALGHSVILVTVDNKEENYIDNYSYKVHRLKCIHLKSLNFFNHFRICSIYLSNYFKLKDICTENKIDRIIVVNQYQDIVFPAIYVSKVCKVPISISIGTQLFSTNKFKNNILKFFDRLICGLFVYPFCKNIIAWDTEILRYLKEGQSKKVVEKVVIIPFAASNEFLTVNNELTNRRAQDYSHLLIGVGAVTEVRNYIFQIKVVNELLKSYPRIKYRIIGHIYDETPLHLVNSLGISNSIEFTGEIKHEDVLTELLNADFHWTMLSGNFVGLGTATLEAMSIGIPAISNAPSNLFGDYELIDMENYIFTDGKDIDEIVNKIKKLIVNKNNRDSIGKNGRKFIKRNLTWEIVGNKIIQLLNK